MVCRQLGLGPAKTAPSGAHFGSSEGQILLDQVGKSIDLKRRLRSPAILATVAR